MATVVVEHAAPDRLDGGVLIVAPYRGDHPQAERVGGVAEALDRHLPRHFGDEVGRLVTGGDRAAVGG